MSAGHPHLSGYSTGTTQTACVPISVRCTDVPALRRPKTVTKLTAHRQTAADKHEEIAMTFIETATGGTAAGTVARLYAEDVACAMAHGRVLRDRFYDPETVRRITTDHTHAGLTPAEVAVMDFADQVARDATSIGPDDIQRLRAHGLSDTDILDVALAAAARCFFSTVLDAMGAQADGALSEDLEPPLRAALTVGRAPQPSDRPRALPAVQEAS